MVLILTNGISRGPISFWQLTLFTSGFSKIQFLFLILEETVFQWLLCGWFVAQSSVLLSSFNSHLDIQVEVGRSACVVWDGVGGWVLRNNDCRHLPWCEPKHIAVLRNHALPRDSASLRPGRWLVFTTQFYLCARIEQTLVQREPVNSYFRSAS